MLVPFVDLKAQFRKLREEVVPRVMQVMEAGSFVLGPDVARFEERFAAYLDTRYCVGVESGTAALQLALEALNVGAGDEVIIPANTYIASAPQSPRRTGNAIKERITRYSSLAA